MPKNEKSPKWNDFLHHLGVEQKQLSQESVNKQLFDSYLKQNSELPPVASDTIAAARPKESKTIDLHGLFKEDALRRLKNEILVSRQNGQLKLIVITGKGLHSQGKAVLKDAVKAMLSHQKGVRQFRQAPAKLGGSGAYLVDLSPIKNDL